MYLFVYLCVCVGWSVSHRYLYSNTEGRTLTTQSRTLRASSEMPRHPIARYSSALHMYTKSVVHLSYLHPSVVACKPIQDHLLQARVGVRGLVA